MFEELKKRTLKGTLAWSIILILAGIGLAGWFAMDAFYVATGFVDFTALEPDEINNQVVKVELSTNLGGCYLEEYSKNTRTNVTTTTDYYYLLSTGTDASTDWRIMSIKAPARYGTQLDAIAEATGMGGSPEPMTLYGKIKKLSSEDSYYFKSTITSMGLTEEDMDAATLPYYIDVFSLPPIIAGGFYIVLFAAGVVLLVYGISRIASAASGSALKKLHRDISDAGYTDASIESDYRSAKFFDKKGTLRVGKLMTYYTAGSIPRALPNGKMMWAYQNTVTHRTNGVKTGTTYNVMVFAETAPKGLTFPVANEAVAQDMLNHFNATLPWVVVGYSDELKKLYNKDRTQFLQLRYNTCEHTAVDPAQAGYGADGQA